MWVATVSNIDWPSKLGLTAERQKAELLAILDTAVGLKLNAVILQVRPMADSLYGSKLEAWSEYLTGTVGKNPGVRPARVRRARGAQARGAFHFRAKVLLGNTGGIADELKLVYAEPALVPESAWLAQGPAPAKPEVAREMAGGKTVLRVKTAPGTRFVVLREQTGDTWTATAINPTGAIPVGAGRLMVSALDRTGRESEAVDVR